MPKALTQPLKWPGGKHYLAGEILARLPRHLCYVEPYAGGASVLLARDPNDTALWWPGATGVSEVLNDQNEDLINFWRCLAVPDLFRQFRDRVRLIPLARRAFDDAGAVLAKGGGGPGWWLERAIAFFVRARQSRAANFKGFTTLTKNRLRRGINGNASEWLGAVEGLPAVAQRLEPVVLECRDGVDVIKALDAPSTFFYCDPPYLHETRATPDHYAHEMHDEQHTALLFRLARVKGKFLLSGYHSKLYDDYAEAFRWKCEEFAKPNQLAGGKKKRVMTECLWSNY
jgi:DNA adenine methylase